MNIVISSFFFLDNYRIILHFPDFSLNNSYLTRSLISGSNQFCNISVHTFIVFKARWQFGVFRLENSKLYFNY